MFVSEFSYNFIILLMKNFCVFIDLNVCHCDVKSSFCRANTV